MQFDFQRIHIVGGPGSGKSTFARSLGKKLGAPVYDLDTIAFQGKDFLERPVEQRLADAHAIAIQPRWITEGIFVGWIDELLRAADVILWLDTLPWQQAAWRILLRFARNGLREVLRQRGRNKFFRFGDYRRNLGQLRDVLISSRAYYHDSVPPVNGDIRNITRAETAAYLADYMSKVIHFQTHQEVESFIANLNSRNSQEQEFAHSL